MSTVPPWIGTTMRTGLVGDHCCALAANATAQSRTSKQLFFIG
jgi:hypothetical protein